MGPSVQDTQRAMNTSSKEWKLQNISEDGTLKMKKKTIIIDLYERESMWGRRRVGDKEFQLRGSEGGREGR